MIKYCKKCFVPSTRPRITFNDEGVCNACQWSEEKKSINWDERKEFFGQLCDKYRGNGTKPDVIVPWSGGKDSIYVAEKMKEFGMTPLCVTVIPHLETEIGKWNRQNMCPNMEHLEINLKEDKYRSLAKKYFIEDGRPKHPWETAISGVIINQASQLGIPLVVYGEEGEQEYGGVSREKDRWKLPVDIEYLMKYYWQNKMDWKLPDNFDNIFFTQWSRFENWSPNEHANFAIAKGMRTEPVRNIGTFSSSSQLSDKLQDLHVYLMFVKFGFGRCTSDVCIGIREGWIDQIEGLEWIETYDGEFPNEYINDYLEYFDMDLKEFAATINKFGNTKYMEHIQYIWSLKEWVAKLRRKDTPQEFQSPNRFTLQRRTYRLK